MAETLVSLVVEKLGSIMVNELEQEVRLVVGVEKEVKKLESNFTAIQAVLADAETKQLKEATTIRDWLGKLKDVTYDIEDVLDDWEAAILSPQSKPGDQQDPKKHERKVCFFLRSSCFCCKQVGLRHDIAKKIKELVERLDQISQEKDRYQLVRREGNPPIERPMTTSMIHITEVKGREEYKNVLVEKLLSEGSDLRVLSIVGTGGIGKTTLAQFTFNYNSIQTCFDEKIWVCVSDPFDEMKIAETILESILGRAPDVRQLRSLLEKIKESIKEKKFLLVLDDVWQEDSRKWDQLKQYLMFGLPGSKILVTTRKRNVASVMGCLRDDILDLKELADEDCWLIVREKAFFDRSDTECKNLESVGREISKKCRGLPLAAKTLGGILQFKKSREEWQSILRSELWELKEAQEKIIAPLWLSYHDLPPVLKRCFSYCAIFPKDSKIVKSRLIELWMAQGYLKEGQSDDLEITGEDYFQNLAMRSFFQDFQKDPDDYQMITSCKMHDMVHDLAHLVVQDECRGVQVNGQVDSIMKVRHLSLECTASSSDGSTSSFNSFDYTKKLRSLLIRESGFNRLLHTTEELSRLFSESTHVRSLSLGNCDFAEIPASIRKLVQLRWLDLSYSHLLKQLPETLCELHSLQTIDVSWCGQLEQLPLGIGKLFNLRHLYNFRGPSRLPKGIGQLSGLRSLEVVDVGCDDDDAFSLGDLKNLNQLRGSLLIKGLGACKCHVGEARQAELKQKERITRLYLVFTEEPHTTGNEELLLLEALEPSPNLEFLEIQDYRGTSFPSWMILLENLRSIALCFSDSWEHLPSLGKLPCLDTLRLVGMWVVKKVGKELLGIETQIRESKSEISASSASSSSSPVVVAFPKLTSLIFRDMYGWEEWDDYYSDNYDGTTKPPPIIIMPSLLSLSINHCPRLKALPNYILQNTTLHSLTIGGNSLLLKERYRKEKGEDWSKISHIPHVQFT